MAHFFLIFIHLVTFALSSCFGSQVAVKNEPKQATCGVVKMTRIVGGTTAENFYPWFVALVRPESRYSEHYRVSCGAALVTAKHVVTAAHCYKARPHKDDLLVVIDLVDRCTKGGKILETTKLDVNTNFDENSLIPNHDIALIYLKEEVSNMPVCLPSRGRYAGKNGIIIGYGSTLKRTSYPCQMQYSEVEIMSRRKCSSLGLNIPIAEKTICAGVMSGGIDACDGDSGGPLMVNYKGSYELIGVVSYGDGCGRVRSPGIYTDVTKRGYLEWIEERLGNYKPTNNAENSQSSQPQKPTLDNSPSISDSYYVPEQSSPLLQPHHFPFGGSMMMGPNGIMMGPNGMMMLPVNMMAGGTSFNPMQDQFLKHMSNIQSFLQSMANIPMNFIPDFNRNRLAFRADPILCNQVLSCCPKHGSDRNLFKRPDEQSCY